MTIRLIALCCFAAGSLCAQPDKLIIREYDSVRIEIEALGTAVNSPFNDYAPVITADGAELFFTTRRPATEREIKKKSEGKERVFYSNYDFTAKKWLESEALPEVINNPNRFNSAVAVSNDGQRLLIYQDDQYGNGDIYESFLKGSFWSSPLPVSAPINTDAHESSASIAPSGQTIYFVSDREGGRGKRDIWSVSKNASGEWDTPKNLGRTINSTDDEESVFIHPDGRTLYFSSRGHGSTGGFDVYRSVWSELEGWSEPENLGDPINTIGDDLFFVMTADGTQAYYASSRDEDSKNLYSIRFTPLSKKTVAEQPKVSLLKGTIFDEASKETIAAVIEVFDNDKNELIGTFHSNDETGKFLVSLPSGKNYGIAVSAPDYLFHSENITLSDSSTFQQITRDISLKKLTAGTKIILKNIFFDYDLYSLKPASTVELERVHKLMTENPGLRIEISGHTDTQGSASYNQQLSENRAKSVVDYLIAAGIDKSRMTYKGYGETQPIISDSEIAKMSTKQQQDEAHAQNRRTEFKVL